MRLLEVRRARKADLPCCRAIRRRVFVHEQGVPESLEVDGLDAECVHFVVSSGGRPVGTARLRQVGGDAKVERVAVLGASRGQGAGQALMEAVEAEARIRGLSRVVLSAQEPVVSFYTRIGYAALGTPFVEAGIPHRKMHKPL